MDTVSADRLLIEGEDYYTENGLMVFTSQYHLRRGYCCDQGCRHCPYISSSNEVAASDLDLDE